MNVTDLVVLELFTFSSKLSDEISSLLLTLDCIYLGLSVLSLVLLVFEFLLLDLAKVLELFKLVEHFILSQVLLRFHVKC